LATARQFIRSYKYLWHVGYAVFKADLMMDLYRKHTPEVYKILEHVVNGGKREEYIKIPKISIDFGIYEKLEKGRIVEMPADLGWSDVGAWNILKDELAENGKALVVKGENYDLGSIDCLFYELNQGKIIATIGCENLVVVDTPDALLVASKFKAQEVKKIVERLKLEGKEKYL
jgi:mannose-1-phosphate guanylyltransferase